MAKTVIEKQIQAYGEFQRQIRGMSKSERLKYAAPETPEGREYQRLLADENERKALRDKAIREYEKANKPMYGNLKGLTKEQVDEIAKLSSQYSIDRRKFVEDLNEKLGLSGFQL